MKGTDGGGREAYHKHCILAVDALASGNCRLSRSQHMQTANIGAMLAEIKVVTTEVRLIESTTMTALRLLICQCGRLAISDRDSVAFNHILNGGDLRTWAAQSLLSTTSSLVGRWMR
jgi:predicted metal-binding membrane protein